MGRFDGGTGMNGLRRQNVEAASAKVLLKLSSAVNAALRVSEGYSILRVVVSKPCVQRFSEDYFRNNLKFATS